MAFIGNWYFQKIPGNPASQSADGSPDEYQFIKDNAQTLSAIGIETHRKCLNLSYMCLDFDAGGFFGHCMVDIPAISNIEVGLGLAISDEEVRRHAPVAFIGQDIVDKFFTGVDPIGK